MVLTKEEFFAEKENDLYAEFAREYPQLFKGYVENQYDNYLEMIGEEVIE